MRQPFLEMNAMPTDHESAIIKLMRNIAQLDEQVQRLQSFALDTVLRLIESGAVQTDDQIREMHARIFGV